MVWAVLAARMLVGLPFLVFGVNFFLKLFTIPGPPTLDAGAYLTVLHSSGYLAAVKVFEVVGGGLVLSGRLVPLGLVLVTPVAVNIAFYDIFLAHKPGPGVVLTALCAFLVWAYRTHFAPVFAVKPKIG